MRAADLEWASSPAQDATAPDAPGRASDPSRAEGATAGGVRLLLRAEGLAVLAVSAAAYAQWGAGWMVFAGFFLLPDLALLGYSWGPRVGALGYNATHAYVGPLALLAFGVLAAAPLAVSLALIWTAHIGFDRALGYGLKYVTGFRVTHLGGIGRQDLW